MASDQWYCKIADRMIGPLTGQQITEMARNGQLRREDQVRTSDSQWSRAGNVQGLDFGTPSTPPTSDKSWYQRYREWYDKELLRVAENEAAKPKIPRWKRWLRDIVIGFAILGLMIVFLPLLAILLRSL